MPRFSKPIYSFLFLILFSFSFDGEASIRVGVGKADLTPPLGTPSAGYENRKTGMEGTHDPLLVTAMVIDNGEKMIAFCGVDHLGFTYEMAQEVMKKVHQHPKLANCEIYIGSSHTHSGGGAFLNIPIVGELLAGPYNPEITQFYINQAVKAIIIAGTSLQPAQMGIGYGQVEGLSMYRGSWPKDVKPLTEIAVIKAVKADGSPLAVLFNFPVHPTVLTQDNLLFSADFVGYTRDYLKTFIGEGVEPIYFNGAQGDIIPNFPKGGDRFSLSDQFGKKLAEKTAEIWRKTKTEDKVEIATYKDSYAFKPLATPAGLQLPIESYKSELNLIVFNKRDAFITIPGELSCLYDAQFKAKGKEEGFKHVSILGLVNDAHGYIILPESWRQKTYESNLSFGGELYGQTVAEKVFQLMLQSQKKAQ